MNVDLHELTKTIRHHILSSTTEAGSGHPTSSMSAVEVMTTLMFGGYFLQDTNSPNAYYNDKLIFSKGHAAPLLYSLYTAAGAITRDELMTLRKRGSRIEGHPTPLFPFAQVTTGSLGQGLSVGLGMALGARLRAKNHNKQEDVATRIPVTYVLLGDSEVAEGQVWEAAAAASYYNVGNLVAILDINRLGQRGETMLSWDIDTYKKRFESFGWNTIVVEDGNNLEAVRTILGEKLKTENSKQPTIILAKTVKGAGVSFLADKEGMHGKPVPKDQLQDALEELGGADPTLTTPITSPQKVDFSSETNTPTSVDMPTYDKDIATRQAYGDALVQLGSDPNVVVLDGETGNSTFSEAFKDVYPDRFFEIYIAEQNMISVALGMSKLGYIPYSSTFSAFLTRAYDQIRMAQYSDANMNICGSYAGASIGEDGASQMGLEDLSMMRSLLESVVLYPADPYATHALLKESKQHKGISYIRTTRAKTPVLYKASESFPIGGSKIHSETGKNVAVVFGAGITLHEALKAQEKLKNEGILIAVVDVYCVKPLDTKMIDTFIEQNIPMIVVEDHYPAGGIGEAIAGAAISSSKHSPLKYTHLCVQKIPHSATPKELLSDHGIDEAAITSAVKKAIV